MLVDVLSAKAGTVGDGEMLRESMKCTSNAWALSQSMDTLDEWTLDQVRPSGRPGGQVGAWGGNVRVFMQHVAGAVSVSSRPSGVATGHPVVPRQMVVVMIICAMQIDSPSAVLRLLFWRLG